MSDSVTTWTVAHQAPLSMVFPRQEYWSGLPFPTPGDLPDPGFESRSPALQVESLLSEPPGSPGLPVQFSSVAQLCPALCDPMDCSTPGLPVHHQLLEFTQTYVHWVSDAIQPSHPLLSPSPPALNLFQHQGLFKWVSSSHQVAKGLKFQLQHQSFQWIFRTDILKNGLAGSPWSPRDSQESPLIPQFKSINTSTLSFLYSPTLTSICDYWKNHDLDEMDLCW